MLSSFWKNSWSGIKIFGGVIGLAYLAIVTADALLNLLNLLPRPPSMTLKLIGAFVGFALVVANIPLQSLYEDRRRPYAKLISIIFFIGFAGVVGSFGSNQLWKDFGLGQYEPLINACFSLLLIGSLAHPIIVYTIEKFRKKSTEIGLDVSKIDQAES